jgi:hypothetical protein
VVGYAGATELNSESEPDIKYWVELKFNKGDGSYVLDSWVQHEIKTRPIIRLKIMDALQVEVAVDDTKQKVEYLKKTGESREPIIFIRYNSLIPGVIERFRKNFDPDKFILRFHPLFHAEQAVVVEKAGPRKELSIVDLLKKEVPESSALYSLASQLFNPELESDHIKASIDQYVEERLGKPNE